MDEKCQNCKWWDAVEREFTYMAHCLKNAPMGIQHSPNSELSAKWPTTTKYMGCGAFEHEASRGMQHHPRGRTDHQVTPEQQ